MFLDASDATDRAIRNQTGIVVWNDNRTDPGSLSPVSDIVQNLFITLEGNIYIDNGIFKYQLRKWFLNPIFHEHFVSLLRNCTSIFIDIKDSVYCSYRRHHQVVKIQYNTASSIDQIIFGNESNGSTPYLLSSPNGIFVDIDLNLYVADTGNNRIQRFEPGYINGTTVAGNQALGEKGLQSPTGVMIDRNGYLYITDCGNQRIIRSESNGFRCIVGCSESHQATFHPQALWFDTNGNLFVFNQISHQIQKFLRLSSSSGKCFSKTKKKRRQVSG